MALRLFLLTLILTFTSAMSASSQLIFIGTYTPKDSPSKGIYAVHLDPATGALDTPVLAAATPNPTFLAWHRDGQVLYALGEGPGPDGKTSGGIAAFDFKAATGTLSLLNSRGTGGTGTTHLAPDATARMLVTVAYGGGYIASFPLAPDGRLGERTSFILSQGPLGPNKERQDKPHPHSVTVSPNNQYVYICDLGRDLVCCYRLDPVTATLTPAGEFASPPGAGPRHSKFTADGKFLYVINELSGSITTYACEPSTGALTPGATVSTLPADFTGTNTSAEIRFHPNGRFIYGSNRGHDSLVVFARDAASGALTRIQLEPSGGNHPRNFELSPDGRWLVCANRASNNLVVFKVDPLTGKMTPTGHTATVPEAVCVLFAPAGSCLIPW